MIHSDTSDRPAAVSSSPRAARTVSRRRAFTVAAGLAATGLVNGCAEPSTLLRMGTAQPGGQFHEFASALATAAAKFSTIRIEPVVTEGSVSNLRLLARGEIDTALALGDSVQLPTAAAAIGRVHECYIQVAVRPDSTVRELGDLRGRSIDLGLSGSGSARTGQRLLQAAGLAAGSDVTVEHRMLPAAVRALQQGNVEAILWGDEVPTPTFEFPVELRLLDLAEWVTPLSGLVDYPYDTVSVPGNIYPGSATVDTLGVPTILLAAPNLSDHTVSAIAELLLTRGDLLVPAQTIGFQFLDRRWLVGTGQVPLHPAASTYYRAQHG
ncbi:TAXI family TRAP transporter solute-binding subunit [Nocardia speluncae]|uniref:TAXI family TRAP transporter solute-binding subunit n=1 Tax=Nocardia speluncae TaxID=419477 RepID=A0A846XAF4_9NOCA|nr:TAXI family TRAP transporter solute-binding subunit [Nocardia speluncae]NKY31790.1 TAXI family TRAP transporter solute-binding subunit [Nocardia speluncae]